MNDPICFSMKSLEGQSSLDLEGEVVDLGVAVDVVHKRLEALVLILLGAEVVGDLFLLDTEGLVLVADDLDTVVSVGAQQGEASRQDDDGVAADDVPSGDAVGYLVEVGSPVLVADSGGTVGGDSNLAEEFIGVDIDEGDTSEASSETDTGDVQEVDAGLALDLSQVSHDVVSDGVPHAVVGLLDLAVAAGVLVGDLEGVEDILPDVEEGVGVSEGEHDELGVDAQDALDVLLLFFDVVGVEGSVGVIASLADPEGQVIFSSDDKRVGEGHLIVVGEGADDSEKQGDENEFGAHGCCDTIILNSATYYYQGFGEISAYKQGFTVNNLLAGLHCHVKVTSL